MEGKESLEAEDQMTFSMHAQLNCLSCNDVIDRYCHIGPALCHVSR